MDLNATAQSLAAMKMLNASLLQQLECPVCLDTCIPPIFMCLHGHNVCSSCKTNIRECPLCRAPGELKIRNLALEALCGQVLIPCKFSQEGCQVEMNTKDLDAHYAVCVFGYQCLCCTKRFGGKYALLQHVLKHNSVIIDHLIPPPLCSLNFDLARGTSYTCLYHFDNELFWIYHRYSPQSSILHSVSYFVGSKLKSNKYRYEIILESPDGRITNTHVAPPLIKSELDDFKTNAYTFQLGIKEARKFFDKTGKLNLKRSIRFA